jgi:DNA-binding LytR/AlgR family response regulator
VEIARRERPDLVLLDIQMPGRSGLDAAPDLQALGSSIVFVTAHDEHALKAFDREAVDYVLKPVRPERLWKAIQRAARSSAAGLERLLESLRRDPPRLLGMLRGDDTRHVLDPALIDYVEAREDGCACRSGRETYQVRMTLQELEEHLQGLSFMRVHKSYLANLENVVGIVPGAAGSLLLKFAGSDRDEIPVGRRHAAELKRRLGGR